MELSSYSFRIWLVLLFLFLIIDNQNFDFGHLYKSTKTCRKANIAFVVYGLKSDGFQTFSKNWNDAIGMDVEVDVFYSIPLLNSRGDNITDEDVEALRSHLLSLNGTANVYLELSGIDFTNVAAALVQQSGEPALLKETNYVTHRMWSLFLSISSSISYATHSLCFSFEKYDFIVVGRLESLAATNIAGPICIDALKRNALPLLRPAPLQYMIEDRIMVIPPCLLSSFGVAMSNPARLFLDSHFELNMTYPKERSIELFIQNALTLAARTGSCTHMLPTIFEPTCVENIWSIPVNSNKYSSGEITRSIATHNFVRDQMSLESTDVDKLFGPNGFTLFKPLSELMSAKVKSLYDEREKCVKERTEEIQLLQERMGWVEGLNASLRGPYKPQIRSVAVVVPIHPPKFMWAAKLVEDHVGGNFLWDLLFIFSLPSDAVDFESSLKKNLRETYSALVMPVIDITPGIVTIKKWWGLTLVHSCYEFIVCIDAETSVTMPTLFANAIRESAAVGNVYQGSLGSIPKSYTGITSAREPCFSLNEPNSVYKPGVFHEIVISTVALLPLFMREESALMTKNCSLYSWFSDIPIYPTEDVRHFFSDIRWPLELPFNYKFDHLLFQLWKISRKEWKSVDLTVDAGWPRVDHTSYLWQLPELQNNPSMWMNLRNDFYPGPLWRPMRLCKVNKEACDYANGVVAIFHLDREI